MLCRQEKDGSISERDRKTELNFEVKPVYVATSVAALWSSRRSWLDAFARSATVLVALVDFAPTAASQLAEPWLDIL